MWKWFSSIHNGEWLHLFFPTTNHAIAMVIDLNSSEWLGEAVVNYLRNHNKKYCAMRLRKREPNSGTFESNWQWQSFHLLLILLTTSLSPKIVTLGLKIFMLWYFGYIHFFQHNMWKKLLLIHNNAWKLRKSIWKGVHHLIYVWIETGTGEMKTVKCRGVNGGKLNVSSWNEVHNFLLHKSWE